MEKALTKDVIVKSVDENMNNTLVRDSALELEMLELFEDITLEDVVANKSCKRHWLVNGVLLNIKPWPVEGEVRAGEFAVARFWVQIHGLPTRCLTNENAPVVAKKIGELVEADGKSKFELVQREYLRLWIDVWVSHPISVGFFLTTNGKPESWVHFKYEKLPLLCFNYAKLAHWDKVCHAPMTMVMPRTGEAVPMYGLWIKSDTRKSNCFNSKGKGVLKMTFDTGDLPEWELNGRSRRGLWKRAESRRLPERSGSTEKGVTGGGGWLPTVKFRKRVVARRTSNRTRKRKAHTWYQPFSAVSNFSPPSSPANIVTTSDKDDASKDTFCIGVGDEGSFSQSGIRGRKTREKNKSYSTRRSSGVKTRSGRKKYNMAACKDVITT
uniref:Zinc knuckle CX2CX4HX4C domain-containing protein n=1 Tax=Cannabis sativa TaxID=3483 RepID=A0A803Q611_CANSA